MRVSMIPCIVALCALFCAAADADIIGPFHLQATGQSNFDGSTFSKTNLTVNDQQPAMGFESVDVVLTVQAMDPPQSILGQLTLFGQDGTLEGEVTSGFIFGLDSPFASASGEFIITGGTGIYEGLAGSGTFNSFTNMETGATQLKLGGLILPAPGALAIFGLAGCLGSRRRRK